MKHPEPIFFRPLRAFAVILFSTLIAAAPNRAFSQPQGPPLHIHGDGIAPTDWTVDQIQKQLAAEITPITYAGHGQPHIFKCVPLISLLKAAGVPTNLKMQPASDPKTKSYSLRFVAVVRGRDGYIVAFSLAELIPDVGNRHVWVALDEDNQPLSAADGPLRLLSPDDQKPARSVHELADITILDTSATTRPD
jgi:hypothetical protein